MLKLGSHGQLLPQYARPATSRTERPAWWPKAATAAVVGSGGALGVVVAQAILGDAGLYRTAVEVATGAAGAVLTVLAGFLFVRRMRRTGSMVDVTLTATVALLATTNVALVALAGVLGTASDHPAALLISAGAGVVVAGGFAFASMTREGPPLNPGASADRRLLWGVCLALALIAAVTLGVGSTGAATDGASPSMVAGRLLSASLFAAAAVGFVRRTAAGPDPVLLWLAVAMGVAAVAALSDAAMPWTPPELSGGDIVQVAGWVALLVAGVRDFEWAQRRSTEDAVSDERRRLARELHDGLAQDLAFIASRSEDAELSAAAERALEESRAAILTLSRPADEPLERMIADTAYSVGDRAGIDVTVAVRPGIDASPDVRQALVRILREAMSNAVRHGGAGHVRVSVDGPGPLVMVVADDGAGFDVGGWRRPDSLGLQSMSERAANVGGRMTVESSVGHGTSVAVVLP